MANSNFTCNVGLKRFLYMSVTLACCSYLNVTDTV